jgi:hypothetical protein
VTVLRRELTLSRSASPEEESFCRIASSRALQSCLRSSVDFDPSRANAKLRILSYMVYADACTPRVSAAQMNPVSSRAMAVTALGLGIPASVIRR